MGNCLRNGSPTASNDHRRRRSPSFAYASSTVYSATKSHFSETVSYGNSDPNTVYSAAKSHFSDTLTERNEGPNPSVRNACDEGGLERALSNLKAFTFAELKTATGNFKVQNLLGEGGSGKVFKGWIDERTFAPSKPGSGMVVVVKKMEPQSLGQLGQWESEVSFVERLSHPNLIRLLGFCSEDVKKTKELLLVVEFMPNGSLADHLFMKNPTTTPLSWNLRLKIAIGAARGLAFLHMSRVIHRDFNPSNILLDRKYNAKLSGFGLAREVPTGEHSHASTGVMGTYDYAAPEYFVTGDLYAKSEVYSFGVVLLEMITGLRAIDRNRPDRQKYLVDWLKPILTNRERLKDIVDAKIRGQYSSKAILRAAQITSRCLKQKPRSRPSMLEVWQALEQIVPIKERLR